MELSGIDSTPPRPDARLFWRALGAFAVCVSLTWTVGAYLQFRSFVQGLLLTELLFFATPAVLALLRDWRSLDIRVLSAPALSDTIWTLFIALAVTMLAVAGGVAWRRACGVPLPAEALAWPLVFALAVPAPLCEELLFRPVLQRALASVWRPGTAVMATALLYGLIHGSLLRFPETFLLGLFSGVIFLKTGNYWACVAFHSLANLLGPAMWPEMERLQFLFSPLTIAFLAGAAVFLAWQMRRPAKRLRGLIAHLHWAFCGHPDERATSVKAGPGPAAAYWAGALVMTVLAGAVTLDEIRHARPVKAGPRVAQTDAWQLGTNGVISARSQVTFERWPDARDSLTFALPYTQAQVLRAEVAGQEVRAPAVGAGTFEVVWPDALPEAPRTLSVAWQMPMTALDDAEHGYRARLQSLLPVTAYSLALQLDPGCGYQFEATPERRETTLFSLASTGKRPRNDFGSTGIGLVRLDMARGKAEPSTP